jgi:hypothetical protein
VPDPVVVVGSDEKGRAELLVQVLQQLYRRERGGRVKTRRWLVGQDGADAYLAPCSPPGRSPAGTEDIYRLYAETLRSAGPWRPIFQEAESHQRCAGGGGHEGACDPHRAGFRIRSTQPEGATGIDISPTGRILTT